MPTTPQNEPWRGIGDDWEVLPGVTGGELLARLEKINEWGQLQWWRRHSKQLQAITPSLLGDVVSMGEIALEWERLAPDRGGQERGAESALLMMIHVAGGVESFIGDKSLMPSGAALIRHWSASCPSIATPLGKTILEAMLVVRRHSPPTGTPRGTCMRVLANAVASCPDADDALILSCAQYLSIGELEGLAEGSARGAELALEIVGASEGRLKRLTDVLCWPKARSDVRIRKMMLQHQGKFDCDGWRRILSTLDGDADVVFAVESIWALLDFEALSPTLVDPEVAADLEEYLKDIYQRRLSIEVLDLLSQSDSGTVRQRAILEIAPLVVLQDDASSPVADKTVGCRT
jgi:hypothetical protein